ncbi:chromosome alignment-maintaining phosphoprotein 1-like [Boleophthalmus pectinirostris]|uniref:chromosome alignment-maintaining phosphoprotein 1-like n=1 Tax=Boleophthalmus pectinirostris TaxID=150288 RepID=UPI002431F9AE|nr:chromosome alignment-maintaining phosphoprotein 1-like [Boleophthalmus pectinirostris]
MTKELEATKLLRFYSNRVECELCGWKVKIRRGTRGFALNHLERAHDLPRRFSCSVCGQSFFMSYQLKEHLRFSHKPGRYQCLFCSFKSDNLNGFRRHTGKCNYRDDDLDEDQDQTGTGTGTAPGPGPRPEPDQDQEDRIHRPRRRSTRLIVEEEDDEEDED